MSELIREPRPEDGQEIWRLVARMGGLDMNSCYAYLLVCSHFAGTSLVVEHDGRLVGFVAAYRPPSSPEDVFVWQIGVARERRGVGLATRMLGTLMRRPACAGARFLTATVGPDNAGSLNLFRGFARQRRAACTVTAGFPAGLFADPHADENLLRIGPLDPG